MSKTVNEVTIYNRTDCCANRLGNFFILITDVPTQGKSIIDARASANAELHVTSVVGNGTTFTMPSGSQGRYVVVYNHTNHLHMAELTAVGR